MHRGERVFCSGTFDLLHPGHVKFLEEAANYGSDLFVSISPDSNLITKEHKKRGRQRVLNQIVRAFMVKKLEIADKIILQPSLIPPYNVKGDLILDRIDTYVCSEDDPFKKEYKKLCKELGIIFIIIKRDNKGIFDISTTKIIEKIKNDY